MIKNIDINEISALIPDINLVDIRSIDEVNAGYIESANHIEMAGLLYNPDQFLHKNETYYIYCHAGSRSAMTCTQLDQQGYNVINLVGGIIAYKGNII